MDSKRLFISIALWLFLSCALLDDVEGQKKRGLINNLFRRKREMAGFIASQIWVFMLNIFILQRQSLSVIT